MIDTPVSLVLNPTAGRGRAGQRLPYIEALFAEAGIPLRISTSKAVGDMEQQVAAEIRGGAQHIIVVGGDGSVHEAVNGLLRAGRPTPLSLIPSGTGNDFAKACGISLDWQQATRSLIRRMARGDTPSAIDVGCMNGRYFANGVGIGFDARVTRVARSIRWPIGNLVYLAALLGCLYRGVSTPHLEIRGDNVRFSGPATLATVCNGSWVGGLFHIAPPADNQDAQLDLLIAAPMARLRILQLLPKLMRGTHLQEQEMSHDLIDSITITANAPVESHIDGEVQAPQQQFDFQLLPGRLKLL
jgi:diacylglycerol kinase (ATP)